MTRRLARAVTVPRDAAAVALWLLASLALLCGGLTTAEHLDEIVRVLFVGAK